MSRKTIRIYGASDDLLEVDDGGDREEYDNYDGGKQLLLSMPDGADILRITSYYDGGWSFGVALVLDIDDNCPMPEDWDIRTRKCADTPYSTELVVDVPADVILTVVGEDEDEEED